MARSTHIQQILDRLPHQPGVYQHFDAVGKLLYVGKAKDLKKTCDQLLHQTTT